MPRLRKSNVVFLVEDIAATMRWYEHLGFKGRAVPDAPPHCFAIISRDDVFIMLQQLDGYVKPDVYTKREGLLERGPARRRRAALWMNIAWLETTGKPTTSRIRYAPTTHLSIAGNSWE